MADFEAPSFSLGLDLDSDLPVDESHPLSTSQSPIGATTSSKSRRDDDGRDILLVQALDSDTPPPALKRLRPYPPTPSSSSFGWREPRELPFDIDDDCIEELSSQEFLRRGKNSSTKYHSSSSKLSLHSHRVRSTQSASKLKDQNDGPASNASTSRNLEAGSSQSIFPKFTVSPLTKFDLLDFDSDDPAFINNQPEDVKEVRESARDRQCDLSPYVTGNEQKKAKIPLDVLQTDNLWKDFSLKKNIKLATPAFDDFCEEYFRSTEDMNVGLNIKEDIRASSATSPSANYLLNESGHHFHRNNIHKDVDCCVNLSTLPPAHRYFYHNDPRVQRLVRDRLRYFFPLDAVSQGGNQHSGTAVIDYMSQFDQRDIPTQVSGVRDGGRKESSKRKNNYNNSYVQEAPPASGSWVNPKSCGFSPRDACKNRVRPNGQSAGSGHWYTSPDGKKVYVAENGKELTGRTAYRSYKKENGGKFKRSGKKASTKKSTKKSSYKPTAKKTKSSSKKAVTKKRSNKAATKKRSKR